MPRAPKRRRYMVEEELDSESEAQGLLGARIPRAVEEDTSSSSSTASSSFPSSSSSSSVTSSSPSPLEEICIFYDTPSPPQSPVSSSYSCPALASTPLSQPSCQEIEVSSTSQALPDTESLPSSVMDGKVGALAEFLLLKYRTKEVTTKAEMLSRVIREHQDHFRAIFSETCECLQLVFGVDVKEVDPSDHSYVMVTSLGLTYDGMGSDEHSMPKTGLLILILCIIFVEGNRVPEEEIWERISSIEIYAGSEHPIYGEPRELITGIFVQEQYLEYQQVPNSDPARYVFLWGPRAHAETSKLKILEFLAEVNNCDPRSFPMWYEEAIRDQEERAQARIATDMASASSSAMSGRFSCLE